MIKRILHIGNPASLSVKDNQLVITQDEVKNTVPFEDIGVIVLDHREITLRTSVFDMCDEHNVTILHCNLSHMPVMLSVPIRGHTSAVSYLKTQLSASIPTQKQLWSLLIRAKIGGQIQVLKNAGNEIGFFEGLLSRLRSGDPENIEAQVASAYWKLLFGTDFVRERGSGGVNACLNYGYGVLRAGIARSVIAGGLHPSIGIWHDNQFNYFNLVDDLIEPFRPLVDAKVFELFRTGRIEAELTPSLKKELLTILSYDIPYRGRVENMTSLLTNYIVSFREGLTDSKKLDIPEISTYLQNKE